ncbi:MAG TPA: hypothetical protein VH255_01305 [Verrucomicrobiae bacterium]|nr:hypothetical protein [Verrucomicrobiae bacterium]
MSLLVLMAWLFWFSVNRPARWGAIVDRENNFWRDRGIISAALAERFKAWEKGWPMKSITAAAVVASAIAVCMTTMVLCKAIALENRRIPMPYNPALHIKPISKSTATNKPPVKP